VVSSPPWAERAALGVTEMDETYFGEVEERRTTRTNRSKGRPTRAP